MRKILKKSLLAFVGLLVFLIIYIVSNPLIWSEDVIKARLLEDVPIGTSMEEAESYVKKKGWKVIYISEKDGFWDQRKSDPERYSCRSGGNGRIEYGDCVVGDKNMRTELGEYRIIFITSVTVFWGFDNQGQLIDIWVWKAIDAT